MAEKSVAVNKKFLTLILLLSAILLVMPGCKAGRNTELAERVYELENGSGGGDGEEPAEIREIRKELNRWEDELNDAITAGRNTGRFYKSLGLKFLDYKMYGPARDSFSRSLEFSPESGRLYYYRAVALSRLALTRQNPADRMKEMTLVEQDYLRAIAMEADFSPPYLSLGILYIYELNRPFEAAPYLEKYVSVERSDSKGQLLYAQLLEEMGQLEKAVDHYNRVLDLPSTEEEKDQAREYIQRIKEEKWQ